MTNPHDRHRQIDREQRRRQVSALMLAGVTDSERIAAQLGVSSRTIRRDIAELEARWQVEAVQDISAAKGKDLERTERLIAALWPEAIKGKWLATDRVLALMQHRARLLGLESPQKREETYRIEITTIVEQIAQSSGLDPAEILAEAERVLAAAS